MSSLMPPESPLDSVALSCGADVDLLLEQAAVGRGADWDTHQRGCVHCQAALGEFTVLWEPVTELAAVPVSAPPGLVAAVMNQVRRLVQDVWYALEVTETGAVRVAARVVAALARDSARMTPGVWVALGRTTQGKLATLAEKATFAHNQNAAVGVLGRTAVVDLAVAVGYGDPAHQIARDIQRHVRSTLRDQVGLRDVTVNVTIDDVLDDDDRR
ncbi:MAG TPA: Asp23/Gls24 family envelope stress response protein [Trebonia sp.]